MRKIIVGLILVLVGLPAAAGPVQADADLGCRVGVEVEGRCLSVDGQATLCEGEACVEFVEESSSVCPEGSIAIERLPGEGTGCELTEPAAQHEPLCPEGARGDAGSCFIYQAIGPDGCFTPSTLDADGNCRRAVADARGTFYCERDEAHLLGRECSSVLDVAPSPCPAETTRFDGACWQMNGLSAPESCAGHSAEAVTELASGRCQVPLAIPTGLATCVQGAEYREHPSFILINQVGEVQGQGPIDAACVDVSVSIGLAVAHCFFVDDDLNWSDAGDAGLCERYEQPVTATCADGYSIDDRSGGLCRRFEAPLDGGCSDGSGPVGPWCEIGSEFSMFECSAETARHESRPLCVAYRTWQGAATCSSVPALLLEIDAAEFGLSLGCFAHVGTQPDRCNGLGTVDACFEILEPAATECATTTGCVTIEGVPILDTTTCAGRVVTVDLNMTPPQVPTEGDDVIIGTPQSDTIDGLGGNDFICGGAGDDVVNGGDGDDLIRGGSGNDSLNGDSGDDRLFGVTGHDTITGGAGKDTLHGNKGRDTLDGGDDDDRLFGYADDDILNGGNGNDKIFGHFGNDTINGGNGDDRLFGWGDDDIIDGGAGNDLISGNFGNDTITGGDGDDVIYGADGDDTIDGGSGNDSLNGNSLDDTINGGSGNDAIDGGIGRDFCNGDAGLDTAFRCETVIAAA